MGNLESNETQELQKNIKHHSKLSTFIVVVIFVMAALTWLVHVPAGLLLALAGGVVFWITYK